MNNTTQTPLAGEWSETTITLAGSKEVKFCKQFKASGLGYWTGKDANETVYYVPTHIMPGYRMVPEPFYSKEICQRYIQTIAPLINWNQPMEALISDPAYSLMPVAAIYKYYHFEDAAATAGGGAW